MLDAILEYVMSRRMGSVLASSQGERHLTRTALHPDLPVNPGAIPIPIDRRRVSGFPWPIPCCSSPIFLAKHDGVDHYTRRPDFEPELICSGNRNVFYTGMGEFKSYRLPLRIRVIDRIVWFAMGRGRTRDRGHAGGASEVRKLLRKVSHIGKKNSQGYGRVNEWKVEIQEDDWSWFAPSDGGKVLMRPLPLSAVGNAVGFRRWFGAVVPPYWMPEAFTDSAVPC